MTNEVDARSELDGAGVGVVAWAQTLRHRRGEFRSTRPSSLGSAAVLEAGYPQCEPGGL